MGRRLILGLVVLGLVGMGVAPPLLHGTPARAAGSVNWQWKGSSINANTTDLQNVSGGLQQLVNTGANSVTIVVTWYAPSIYSTDMYPVNGVTPSDAAVVSAIHQAESDGLKVVLKLHLDSQDGSWSAYINPTDYHTWFTNYSAFVLHYADIAQQNGVSLFVIGNELIAMATNSNYASYWRQIVASTRQHFSGQLTYNANWGAGTPPWNTEYPAISWWDVLDYVGISAYFELTKQSDASVSQIKAGWPQYESQLASFAAQVHKPILFTEGGYRSVPFCAEYPWNWSSSGSPDQQAQANAYEALFEYWASGYPWFAGMETWQWSPYTNVDPNSTGYEVQNKLAYQTLKSWWSGSATTATSTPTPTLTSTPSPTPTNTSAPSSSRTIAVEGTDQALHVDHGAGFSSLGGVLLAAPAVVTLSGGNHLYLVTGQDHQLWVRSDAQPWQLFAPGSYCSDNPAASRTGSTLIVACQGSDHAVWSTTVTLPANGFPSAGSFTTLGGITHFGPALAPVAGTLTTFVTGTDNRIWYRTPGTSWQPLASWCTGHPAAAWNGTTTFLACHGSDNGLWYATNTGSGWSTFQSLGEQVVDGPGIAATSTGTIFVIEATDQAIWQNVVSLGGVAGGWQSVGGAAQHGAAATAG